MLVFSSYFVLVFVKYGLVASILEILGHNLWLLVVFFSVKMVIWKKVSVGGFRWLCPEEQVALVLYYT